MTMMRFFVNAVSTLALALSAGCVELGTEPGRDPTESLDDEDGLQLSQTEQGICTHPTITKYPGNTGVGNRREGQVDVHFDVCSEQGPTGWGKSIRVSSNLAMSLAFDSYTNPDIVITSSGSDREGPYAYFTASFDHRNCSPPIGCCCVNSGTYRLFFAAGVSFGSPYVAYQGFSAFSGNTIYNTP
jgi:hypothetical protein